MEIMKNKILIRLIVPTLNDEYEIYIPVNERIVKIKELFIKILDDLTDGEFDTKKNYSLIDPDDGKIYDNRVIVRETNIKNSKRLILY
jgi:hypothetical protein